ncbi:MAG TPA: response regulator [Verrucomicrobiae bacterium]|nr:response regulator [Verrucomicrobiae bacterium]
MGSEFNILLAEDNSDDVFLMEQAFKRAGGEGKLFAVCDGTEALAYLRGEGQYQDRFAFPLPDTLLLDLNMPRTSGYEVLEQVRGDPQLRRLIIHVLTGSAREADVQRAYDLGANDYFVKPNRIDDLVAFVRALHAWHGMVRRAPLGEANSPAPLRVS